MVLLVIMIMIMIRIIVIVIKITIILIHCFSSLRGWEGEPTSRVASLGRGDHLLLLSHFFVYFVLRVLSYIEGQLCTWLIKVVS